MISLLDRRFSRGIALAALGAAVLVLSFASSHAAPPDGTKVQVLIKPKRSMTEVALHAILSSKGAAEHGAIRALDVRIIRVPAAAAARLMEALQKHPDVEYAEPDFVAKAIGTANDPYYTAGYAWHLGKIQAPAAWDVSTGAAGVVVAVVDTGVNAAHPDLAGKVLAGYDFVSSDTDPSDDDGHGTAVAGTIAPASNNLVGVVGVAWGNVILPVKVLGADGSGTYSNIANGITYAADRGARIINLSLGGPSSSLTLQNAVNYAWSKQCVVIAAAGNDGNNTPSYPGACANVVAVSATGRDDTRPTWSNFGSYVDVSAPGEDIVSLYGADEYAYWSGTSFSSPVTAGVAALMASANSQLSNTQLVDLLIKNCDDLGALGYDVNFGHGRVNAYRAVIAARNYRAPDTTLPVATIASPLNGAIIAATASVSVRATDNVGVSRVDFYVDARFVAQSASGSATFSLNTLAYADGAHTLQARAYDAAGNVGTASISVTVKNATRDSTAPVAKITSPVNGSRIPTPTLNIYVNGTDNVAVTKIELYLNGRLFRSSTGSSVVFSWSTLYTPAGTHTLQAYAYDAAGNVGASARISVWK